jgi:hypothetical protein
MDFSCLRKTHTPQRVLRSAKENALRRGDEARVKETTGSVTDPFLDLES